MNEMNRIPETRVAADTVGDLMNSLRVNHDVPTPVSAVQSSASEVCPVPSGCPAGFPDSEKIPSYTPGSSEVSFIPPTKVAADQDASDQLTALKELQDLLSSDEPVSFDPYGRLCRKKDTDAGKPTIPNTKVASDTVGDLTYEHLYHSDPDHIPAYTPGSSEDTIIPPSKVAAAQWYQTNPALYQAEISAMRKALNNPTLEPKFKPDDCMYWEVAVSISAAPGIKPQRYVLELIYDADHPSCRYGTSIKTFVKSPTMEQLDADFNKVLAYWHEKSTDPDEKKKLLPQPTPHTLSGPGNRRYLCSSRISDTSASLDAGITSAVTSLRYSYRWLTVYQASLYYKPTLMSFLDHGKI